MVLQDVRYALRSLGRSPAFTAVAIVSLALGIGANTTIFSVLNAVLFQRLPYPAADRIVVLQEQPLGGGALQPVHPRNFLEWRARARSLDALVLTQAIPINTMAGGEAEQGTAFQATPELFRVFGVPPALGRAFTAEESLPGDAAVVILSHAYWQRRFGSDPAAVGKGLLAQGRMLTIVGVAAAGFRIGTTDPDLFLPLQIDPARPESIGSRSFQCFGRLKPGIGLAAAQSEMSAIAGQLARQYPPLDKDFGVALSGLHDDLVKEARPVLRLLMSVVGAVLIIACVNLAALLLARGIGRRGEFALRASLGAGRARIVQQLVIESLVLAAIGGAGGLLVALAAMRALAALSAGALTFGSSQPIGLDARCLAFTFAASLITSLIFGLLPAWQASRVDPQRALGERGRGATTSRRQHWLRSGLVVAEVALAVVLLVGAGLLLRTFSNLLHVNLGFQPAGTVSMRLFLAGRDGPRRVQLIEEVLDRIEVLPGVQAAGTIQFLPFSGLVSRTTFRTDEIRSSAPNLPTTAALISRGYFAAMGIPVLEGRPFDRRDHAGSPRVVIVNRAFEQRYFPGASALGRRIVVSASNEAPTEIIGVVGDTRLMLAAEPEPMAFLLHAQAPGYIVHLVVRTTGDPLQQTAAVRGIIRQIDVTQGVSSIKTMEQYLEEALARPRLYAWLVGAFAVLAAGLAMIGVYGLIAYVVSQRTHEIGIRLALGAPRGVVFRSIFGYGAALTFIGAGLGAGIALWLRQLLATLVFGVTPGDAETYAIAIVLFAACALAASAIPARRAARVNAVMAMRGS